MPNIRDAEYYYGPLLCKVDTAYAIRKKPQIKTPKRRGGLVLPPIDISPVGSDSTEPFASTAEQSGSGDLDRIDEVASDGGSRRNSRSSTPRPSMSTCSDLTVLPPEYETYSTFDDGGGDDWNDDTDDVFRESRYVSPDSPPSKRHRGDSVETEHPGDLQRDASTPIADHTVGIYVWRHPFRPDDLDHGWHEGLEAMGINAIEVNITHLKMTALRAVNIY